MGSTDGGKRTKRTGEDKSCTRLKESNLRVHNKAPSSSIPPVELGGGESGDAAGVFSAAAGCCSEPERRTRKKVVHFRGNCR